MEQVKNKKILDVENLKVYKKGCFQGGRRKQLQNVRK